MSHASFSKVESKKNNKMSLTSTNSQNSSKSSGEYLDLEPIRVIGSGSFGKCNFLKSSKVESTFLVNKDGCDSFRPKTYASL